MTSRSSFRLRLRLSPRLEGLGSWAGGAGAEHLGDLKAEGLGDGVDGGQRGRLRVGALQSREGSYRQLGAVSDIFLGPCPPVPRIAEVLGEAPQEISIPHGARKPHSGSSFPGSGLLVLSCREVGPSVSCATMTRRTASILIAAPVLAGSGAAGASPYALAKEAADARE